MPRGLGGGGDQDTETQGQMHIIRGGQGGAGTWGEHQDTET